MHLKENQTYVQGYGSQEGNQEAEEEKALSERGTCEQQSRDLSLDRQEAVSATANGRTSRETFVQIPGLMSKFVEGDSHDGD
jgi:hypothetical protein